MSINVIGKYYVGMPWEYIDLLIDSNRAKILKVEIPLPLFGLIRGPVT
jgi:hypothetical protein